MIKYIKRLATRLASLFRANRQEPGTTCMEVSRRGSVVIVRNYKDCMFHVVDTMAEGGPELVGEYAIYRNAVRAAELREQAKRHRVCTVPENPKTGTVTFHEVIVCRDGTRKLEWIECPSEGCFGTGQTETRTIRGGS